MTDDAVPGVEGSAVREPSAGAPTGSSVHRDGRSWRLGGASDVDWLGDRPNGCTVETAVPLVFEAYATSSRPEAASAPAHERAVVDRLLAHTGPQPWWLGYLDTGAHDVVFPSAPRVQLYWGWPYVLVQAGPEQALAWRTGHLRDGSGSLPDLFFPQDRSWLVSALWDDAWSCVGGPAAVVEALVRDPLVGGRRVQPEEDLLPPGLRRD